MKKLSIVITRPPFGTINAAEALRFANGAAAYGHDLSLILVNDGVLTAKRNQKAEPSGYTSLSPLVENLAKKGSKILIDAYSVSRLGLCKEDFVKEVKFVDICEISSNLLASEMRAIF